MSAKQPRPYAQILSRAEHLVDVLRPGCERIEIAGSLRRGKAEVSDIEIIVIPKPLLDLFGEPGKFSQVDAILGSLPIAYSKRGPKQKQFLVRDSHGDEIQVDLFVQTDPETWGVNYLIRTGDALFSKRMVTPTWQGGFMPSGFSVKNARVWCDGEPLPTPQESDVFDLWKMAFVDPRYRELAAAAYARPTPVDVRAASAHPGDVLFSGRPA